MISSCGFNDSFEQEASFLEIKNVNFETVATQGANTHLIKDVWVYANGDLLGVFSPPTIIPVLSDTETTEFSIFAGIRNNGNNTTPYIYPMMSSIKLSETLVPGETITRDLTFVYRDDLYIDYIEGFEGALSFSIDADDDLETNIVKSSDDVRSGLYSGLIEVSEEHPKMEVESSFAFDTEKLLGTAYIELDYKSETDFVLGIQASSSTVTGSIDHIFVPRRDEWNKIYIDLTLILFEASIEDFSIYIRAVHDGASDETQKVYIDNLKYLYY